MTTLLTIIRDGKELDVDVEFDYTKAERGSRDKFGVPMTPDYPESFEFLNCEETLTQAEIDKAREQCQDLLDAQRWAGR